MVSILPELDASAFTDILEHIKSSKKYTKKCMSISFGITKKISHPPDISRQSWLDPRLFYLLTQFANTYVSIPYTTIQLNYNYPEKQKLNNCYVVAFGKFDGGQFVYGSSEKQHINITYRPIVIHTQDEYSIEEFTGDRFSLVFYSVQSTRKLDDYEAVFVDGEWKIGYKEHGMIVKYLDSKNGLTPPLKRKKKLEVIPEMKPLLFNNDAQNLLAYMLTAQQHRFDN